jgi:hypothetical protein
LRDGASERCHKSARSSVSLERAVSEAEADASNDHPYDQPGELNMQSNGEILKKFYADVIRRDLSAARGYLADDLVFVGLFETYRSAEEYIAALTGLLQVTVRLDVKKIIAEGNDAAVFFELETKAPAEGTVLVAEWHQFKNGKITHVAFAFDGRRYAAMFTGKAVA